jgi:SPP1 gp7 family putative phage head morphogenesis protein
VTAVVLVAADTPKPDGPPGQPYISPDDLASIGPLWDEAVDQHLMPLAAGVWSDSAGMISAEMLDATDVEFPFPSVESVAAENYLAQVRNVYDGVGDDLWQTCRDQLSEGFAAGESIPQLADRLRASAGLTAKNAILVARSTVIEASNAGAIATARAAGVAMQKEWIATPDERTRPTHHAADGQKVALADSFTVGGFSADVPGDPGLPPQEKYNCRCTVGFVMTDAVAKRATRDALPEVPLPGTSGATNNRIIGNPNPINPVATTPQERVALRKAARVRQKAIAATEPVAKFAAEIDNIARARAGLPFDDEATKLLTQRLAQAEAEGIPAVDLAAVRTAVDARDLARVRAEAQTYASSRGLAPIGSAGERLPFNPSTMQTVDGAAAVGDGDLVEVIRQGHVLTLTGEEIQLDRAVVSAVVDSGTVVTQDLGYVARQDAVRRLGEQAPAQTRRMGGQMANTSLLTYSDGSKLIEKVYNRAAETAAELKHEVDAEQLGSKVLEALGLRAPAVVATSRDRLLIEYFDGELGADIGWEAAEPIIESDQGHVLGLADVLMANADRNMGNWLMSDSRLVGIDHGAAFYNQLIRSEFTVGLTEYGPTFGESAWAETIDISPADLALVRDRLTALRPDFVALKRISWFNQMMSRLRQAEKRATGTRNRIV